MSPLAVELKGLSKNFGSLRANDGVDLKVRRATIHGIVGENGAGKSTAMKMLFGLYLPTEGEIYINGQSQSWSSPSDAMAKGVGMVHQHFMLAPSLTVLDNILLGTEKKPFAWLRAVPRTVAKKQLLQLSKLYQLEVDFEAKISELPVGIQQRVEILKLLWRNCDILILDEPTAVLTPQETELLFNQLRRLKNEGKTILIITHKLHEVLRLTDEVTVFREGKVVGHRQTANTNIQELASLMVGRHIELGKQVIEGKPTQSLCLNVDKLTLPGILNQLTVQVRSGEIVGVAGVDGNGQSELLNLLVRPSEFAKETTGKIEILNQVTLFERVAKSSKFIRNLSVGLLPEDRIHQGLLSERPVFENFVLGRETHLKFRHSNFGRHAFLNQKAIKLDCESALEEFDIRPRDQNLAVGKLSGGNQQKLVAARELRDQPKFVIAAHPTRGVDIGATEFIHTELVKARDRGAGVLLISSELEEILQLADRVLVFYRGQIQAEFKKGNYNEQNIGIAMAGGTP